MATELLRWPGVRSEYNWIPAGPGETRTKPHQVGVAFSAHRDAVFSVDGRTRRSDIGAGQVFVTGAEPIVWHEIAETTEALEIYLDTALLESVTGKRPEIASGSARDGVVLAAAGILRRAHLGGGVSDIAANTIAHRLAEHLAHRYGSRSPITSYGVLPWPAVDRITDFVEAHLSEVVTLTRLADVAGLSPFHFARQFKAATGLTPHQFVTGRRIERATQLLAVRTDPVTEIATAVGLPNTSHFRRLFHRHTGTTPAQVRAYGPLPPFARATGTPS